LLWIAAEVRISGSTRDKNTADVCTLR